MTTALRIKRLDPRASLPEYATDGAACFDLRAMLPEGTEALYLTPGHVVCIHTGLAFEVPVNWRMDVFSRSSHGKVAVALANSVGKIDSDYRGELMILLHNTGKDTFVVRHGDRIAQAELNPVYRMRFELVEQLSETARGAGGFGSTGA